MIVHRPRIAAALVLLGFLALAAAACDDDGPPLAAPNATTPLAGWEKIHDRPASQANQIEMLDGEFGLAVIGHSMQKTVDGGRSWTEVATAPLETHRVVIGDRLHWWMFDHTDSLHRTMDGGQTWTALALPADEQIDAFSVVSTEEAWLTAYAEPYQGFPPHGESALIHTTDGGDTWTKVTIPGYGIYLGAWFIGADGWVLATQCRPGDPTALPNGERSSESTTAAGPACVDKRTLLHTIDAGATWEVLATEPEVVPDVIVRTSDKNARGQCNTSACRNVVTTDSGRTWKELDREGSLRISITRFRDAHEGWAATTECKPPSGGACESQITFLHTTDGGLHWEPVGSLDGWLPVFGIASYGIVAAARGGSGIDYYDTSTARWYPAVTNAGPEPHSLAFESRDVGSAGASNSSYLATADGGATWLRSDLDPSWTRLPGGVLARWPFREGIHISNDGGQSWRAIPPPTAGPWRLAGRVVAAAGDRVWVDVSGTPWRTVDAGVTWRRLIPYGLGEYHFVDADHGWLSARAEAGAASFITSDGGDTWRPLTLPVSASGLFFTSSHEAWAIGFGSPGCLCIITSKDGATTWQTISTAPWYLDQLIVTSSGELWGLSSEPLQPDVVITSSDGGATWREDFRIDAEYPMTLTSADGRLWLYYSTSRPNYLHDTIDPPGRTIIYRREIAP